MINFFVVVCIIDNISISHVDIGVDVHINRITNRLGWNTPATVKGQEKRTKYAYSYFFNTPCLSFGRQNLESWLPRELWYDINHKFVGFGQVGGLFIYL
jgi:endonuclease-3